MIFFILISNNLFLKIWALLWHFTHVYNMLWSSLILFYYTDTYSHCSHSSTSKPSFYFNVLLTTAEKESNFLRMNFLSGYIEPSGQSRDIHIRTALNESSRLDSYTHMYVYIYIFLHKIFERRSTVVQASLYFIL